jgi:hypothetical protein
MATTTYKVTVQNHSPYEQNFFFFQSQPIYTGNNEIFSNSLGTQFMKGNPDNFVEQIKFELELEFTASVQRQKETPTVGRAQTGKISQETMSLTTATNSKDNMITMEIDKNKEAALGVLQSSDEVPSGCFRITTPPFSGAAQYNIGTGSQVDGLNVMSNFITGQPNLNYDIQPVLKFYVAVGSSTQGNVINYTTESVTAALCDGTKGTNNWLVTYKADGTWGVHNNN